MQSGNTQFLTTSRNVLGSQHGSVWAALIAIGFDFHSARDAHQSFATTQIRDMHKSVIETSKQVSDTKDLVGVQQLDAAHSLFLPKFKKRRRRDVSIKRYTDARAVRVGMSQESVSLVLHVSYPAIVGLFCEEMECAMQYDRKVAARLVLAFNLGVLAGAASTKCCATVNSRAILVRGKRNQPGFATPTPEGF